MVLDLQEVGSKSKFVIACAWVSPCLLECANPRARIRARKRAFLRACMHALIGGRGGGVVCK